MEEFEWPDYLDEETGIFRYYGDNREPGRELTDTKKTGNGRDIQFLWLAAPGNPKISPDKDLVAFWRTVKEKI